MIVAFLILSFIYVSVKVYSFYIWKEENPPLSEDSSFQDLSILIIARDEEKQIKSCLTSIVDNSYPSDHYEIILIDDHSTDRTIACAQSLNISNLRIIELSHHLSGSDLTAHKKAAQKLGVELATNGIILQTDADCFVPRTWIQTMSSYLDEHRFVTGPIKITGKGFLSNWQLYDGLLTVLGTFAGIYKKLWYSSNAGNMAFYKSDFNEFVNKGYSPGASGDDIFFVNFLASQNSKIAFANTKSAVVSTAAEPTASSLFSQRLRWATKTKAYPNNGIQILMASVFIFYAIVLLLFLSLPFLTTQLLYFLVIGVFIKWITDLILLVPSSDFFNEKYSLIFSPFFSMVHLIYVVIIGCAGLVMKEYKWKGRQVS